MLFTYWISILPGVGESITYHGHALLRGLPTDLNFTFALAIITIVAAQAYAIKTHGLFGNVGRYLVNPLKNPIGAFEGLLELIGELSRLIALSLRLFGNAFAGEVLLAIIAMLSGWFAALSLPFLWRSNYSLALFRPTCFCAHLYICRTRHGQSRPIRFRSLV